MPINTETELKGNLRATNGISESHGDTYLNGWHHLNDAKIDPGTVESHLKDTTPTFDTIAICGLGIRLPGGVRNAEDFWDLLVNGKDAQGEIRSDRYDIDSFNGTLGNKGAINTRKGYFLDDDLTSLDASCFSMSRNELERSDPQQRQLLEVTRECLESAGEIDYKGKLVGCYVGTFGEDWLQMSARETQHSGGYILTGHGDLMLSNRVSYEYDLRGPSMVIKTGCSASLIALHEACRALISGDCCAAIVAGTSLIMGPATTAAMMQEGILSSEGSCKTFDVAADGFARAEAINAIYVKKLGDALKDGNPIRAVIRNTGTNSDGKSQSLMTPSSDAHEALIRKVYSDAGLIPSETGYVECHGTGTPTGDPLEAAAVGRVFGEKGVYIGSVKPNVGHSEGASGITSLIKVILSLQHGIIPPSIKFRKPNPKIAFKENRLVVPTKATSWPQDRKKRASINSFGIGGTNAHVVVDSPDAYVSVPRNLVGSDIPNNSPHLLVFSANTQDSLRQQVLNNTTYLEKYPDRVLDMVYTLAQRREHHVYRTFCIVGDDGTMAKAAATVKIPSTPPDIVMIFSGQGAQWPTMGRELVLTNPEFRNDIGAMDSILQALQYPPAWGLEDELFKVKSSQIHRAELAQPLCTAVQLALVNLLRRSGIEPTAVIGHSSGEIAAAYAARAVSFREAIIIAYYRGYVARRPSSAGGMLAVSLGADAVSDFLKEGVVIACENSPKSVTLSGDIEQLHKVGLAIRESKPDVLARTLKVDMAYHSHHMVSLGKEYRSLVEAELANNCNISLATERTDIGGHLDIMFYSSVTGKVVENSVAISPEYWQTNLTSPVRFDPAVQRMLQHQQNNVFLEIGPHSTLAGPLRQICSEVGADCLYIPTIIRNNNCVETILSAWGQLYQQGIPLSFEPFTRGGSTLSDLASYPWDHSASYWYESRLSKDWRFRKHGYHGLLGLRVGESTTREPSWRNVLSLEDEPWLYDHKIRGDVVFPFAGYAAMAGECIRQVLGTANGYSLRHVVVHSALVLTDLKPVEMITALRPHKLTDSEDSDWFEFTISSNSGSTWMRNCEGQVKSRQADLGRYEEFNAYPREVTPSRWYAAMRQIGFNYGPEFSGLTKITSSTTEKLSVGEIENSYQEAPYVFHPTAIDACLQLLLVAMSKGVGRNFGQVAVPTRIEEIEVARSASTMSAKAGDLSVSEAPGINCLAEEGRVCLRLRGVYLTPMDDEEDSDSVWDRYAAARLEWAPDFDFFDTASLFKPPESNIEETMLQEEMTLLCILDSSERLQGLETDHWHFRKYRDWLQKEVGRAKNGSYPVVKNLKHLVKLDPSVRRNLIEEYLEKLQSMGSKAPVATGIKRINDNIESLFTGKADTLDILMQGDVLTNIYNVVSFGHGDFVRVLSHTKPDLRVLEVGAGTGGTTVSILEDLVDRDGYPLYSLYSFTDISAGFFPQAKERFSRASNMEYRIFDISQNPIDQAFELKTYDLILAPNVIHATPSLYNTLCNLRPLLRPDGYLVLTELSALARAPNYIFGNFSGWWLGEADGRPDEPYVSVDRWDQELKAAGFTGVDTAVFDAEVPYQYCAAIVSQPRPSLNDGACRTAITILYDQDNNEFTSNVLTEIKSLGIDYSLCHFGDPPPKGKSIVTTLDLESYFFEDISKNRFRAFQDLLVEQDRTILWLTRPSQILCEDPRSAQTIGVARTIRSELAIPFVTLEINPKIRDLGRLVMQVFGKIQSRKDDSILTPDMEYAVDEGVVKVGRYHPFSLQTELSQNKGLTASHCATTLEIMKPGLMHTLQWSRKSTSGDIGEDDVEIETAAVGLNFRDVLLAMGILRYGLEGVPLGIDTTGVIRRVGSNVRNVTVGDRIFALAPYGCITDRLFLPSSLAIKLPDGLTFEDAATMPCCFATAIHSLLNIGGMNKGQTVLIHSASGGVGNASIQICKMIGAEVYATVGNEEKAKYLMDNLQIPRNHIFSSHDTSFLGDLMRETKGRGVDLVLNSLSGELLHASWKCVAKFGKLIELGKRDIVGFGKLEMDIFEANRSYCCADIAHLVRDRPEQMAKALEKCLEMYRQGHVSPIRPLLTYGPGDVTGAFRALQNADHIGKVILKLSQDDFVTTDVPSANSFTLDPRASYLLAGGLGGLGRSIATWMVEHGARDLIFLSRGAGLKESDKAFFKELVSMHCTVSAIAGMTQRMEDVMKAKLSARGPIRGVIQLAMALRDKPVINMTHEEWITAILPKVNGTWNLHEALIDQPLDFFFMSSSTVTIVNQPGQGNYNAANTFLEAFCQYRHSLDLPASVLNICPVEDVGFVAENPAARKNLKAQGHYFLQEEDFIEYLQLSLLDSQRPASIALGKLSRQSATIAPPWENTSQIVMGLRSEIHPDDPSNRTHWRRDRRMGIYHNIKNTNTVDRSASDNQLKQFLLRCEEDPDLLAEDDSECLLANEIGLKVFSLMLKDADDMDIEMTLSAIGLDSLMAIELRRWWKQAFGLEISVLEIMGLGTIKELSKVAAQRLKVKLEGGAS